MTTEEEVRELIDCHSESDYLDFKEKDYSSKYKSELIKDLIAFGNSHSLRNKYILIGIKEKNNVCEEIIGVDKNKINDEASFQQVVNTYIKENLIVEHKVIQIAGKDVLVIKIPVSNNSNRPFMVKKQIDKLKENEIYIRKGSSTDLANKKDLEYMFKDNKESKLVLKTYLNGILSNELQFSNLKEVIKKFLDAYYKGIIEYANKTINLICDNFEFNNNGFLGVEDVIFDEKEKEFIEKWLISEKISYDKTIFEFKNVKWRMNFSGGIGSLGSKILQGNEKERERYWNLKDLDNYIKEYCSIKKYYEDLPDFYGINLLISNNGNYYDEEIELKLIINQKDIFSEKLLLRDDIFFDYLGNLFETTKSELIECPKISNVDEYSFTKISNFHPSTNVPSINPLLRKETTYEAELSYKSMEFKYDLEDIFDYELYEEDEKVIIKIPFNKIMQNKSMFLPSKLLFKNKNIKIDFEIRSKNNSNVITGTIE